MISWERAWNTYVGNIKTLAQSFVCLHYRLAITYANGLITALRPSIYVCLLIPVFNVNVNVHATMLQLTFYRDLVRILWQIYLCSSEWGKEREAESYFN